MLGFLWCVPTLNSGCVYSVTIVLSGFSDTQQVNHELEQGKIKDEVIQGIEVGLLIMCTL